jgi:hypothetical protein
MKPAWVEFCTLLRESIDMIYLQIQKLLLIVGATGIFAMPACANKITTTYPWLVKAQEDLTKAECMAARLHDTNYWWSGNKCHVKSIRYAWGVAIRDAVAQENRDSIVKKGQLLEGITQYRPNEGMYCEHGGGCYPAKDVKLLGSVLTGPYDPDAKPGDDAYQWQAVESSCELILADRTNIVRANAQEMLRGCR